MKHEWKKAEKILYQPMSKPTILSVPKFSFFSIHGQCNPNDPLFGEYIGVLYALSYAVKMSPKKGNAPEGYFDYTVYPLEGEWDITEEAKQKSMLQLDKNSLVFDLMIRQPDFVTIDFASKMIEITKRLKPHPLLEQVQFVSIEEGSCVQMLHLGSYDNEPQSFAQMEAFCGENNLVRQSKKHREIYLSDARKVSTDKLKTILRFKV